MNVLKEEFLSILENYQGILHKVSLVYFRNGPDREDNFQEIVYQLWKSFPGLRNRESIGSWIYAVSINTSISRLKKGRRITYCTDLPEKDIATVADEEAFAGEEEALLLKAIHRLGEIDRSIMLLYLEEKSYDEISEITGISKSNVGVRINRAKENLKRTLNYLEYGKQ